MAATATTEPPTGVLLIELEIGAGYASRDQLWRTRAARAGVDPSVFLPAKGVSRDEPMSYCVAVRSGASVWALRSISARTRTACGGGTSDQQRIAARPAGWDAERLLAELG